MHKPKETVQPIEAFQSQFDQALPIPLQRTVCGITSLRMAMKTYGYLSNMSFSEFTADWINQTSFDVPALGVSTEISGHPVTVPVCYNLKELSHQDMQEAIEFAKQLHVDPTTNILNIQNGHTPTTGFTIRNGFHHRGIKPFMDRHNIPIESELLEKTTIQDIISLFKENRERKVLLSVRHNDLGYPSQYKIPGGAISTHIILIHSHEVIGSTDVLTFSDPAFLNKQDGIQSRTADALQAAFTGTASILTPKLIF